MSIQGEIDRINQNIADTYSVLNDAGAAMPTAANSENLAATAAGIAAVLYNKDQGLSDAQKEQARTNIGALAESELGNAVNNALEQAKESGEFDGEPGAPGTSVTVSSVTESTEDGGTNVVNFSDGTKLNVKNGSKGGDGAPGERGVTFTPAVDADGNLSWSNDGDLENPPTVNIRGPAAEFDESQIDNIVFITVEDIDEICNPQPDEPDVPANTFQKVRSFQDGKEYILLFGYNGAYYYLSNEAFNDWTVLAKVTSEVTSTDAQITFTTVPTLFTARASGEGFTLHNGDNNVYAYAQSNGTGLRISTETAAVFTVDTSEMGGFDSDEIIAKVDDDAIWLRSAFEAGNACLKFESANTSVGIDYKDRDATYSTGFLSFVLYEKIS